MDRFGLTKIVSFRGKRYTFVIVDGYSIFTWILFLTSKDEEIVKFSKLCEKF